MITWLKTRRRDKIIAAKFGSTHPDRVTVIAGDQPLAINPRDGRVRKILLYDTARGRAKTNQVFWQQAIAAFDPTIGIDVGLNYGECLLASHYDHAIRLHGFEANPGLLPYLEQTRADHPQADSITLHGNAVSDVSGEIVHLAVDEKWSGTSHLTDAADDGTVPVESIRIDDAVPSPDATDRLLVKIDVEGFEAPVVAGMTSTVEAAGSVLGFVEFSPDLMASRGQDVPAYWNALRRQFNLYHCSATGEATPIANVPFEVAEQAVDFSHCDLILTAGDRCEQLDTFFKAWRGRKRRRAAA